MQESLDYFTHEERKVNQIIQTIEQWTVFAKSKLEQSLPLPDLRPEDSVSNILSIVSKSTKLSKGSVNSRASKSSSFASAVKLHVSTRKAALLAEIASLKRQQALEREELLLNIKLETDQLKHKEAKLC